MARIDESIFLLGKVTYNTFDIDFAVPFENQEDKLSEDLIQVEYDNGYIIDVGWYPEMDPKGCLKVVLMVKKCIEDEGKS
jgi:hypothetical protein